MDGTGNVFVADSGNSTIRKITASGLVSTIGGRAGEQGWLSGTAARFYGPMGIAVTEGGQLYVADDGNHRVVTTVGVSAKLNDMIISSGVLDPAFSGNTTGYTASVG